MPHKIKPKKFIKFLDFGSYPGNLLFIYNTDYKNIARWASALDNSKDNWLEAVVSCGEELNKPLITISIDTDQKYFIMKFGREFKFKAQDYIDLAHEVFHVVQFYTTDISQNREIEAEAYLHSHIMTQCINAIRTF